MSRRPASVRALVGFVLALVMAGSGPGSAAPGAPDVAGPDVPPSTEPDVVVTAFEDERFECTEAVRTRAIAVPAGVWDRIILEFSSTPDGDIWDRLFGVAIGGVEVLHGTTPRTEFMLRKDVTEFAALLPPGGTADVSLLLGSYVGALLGSVRIEFYADEPTAALVRSPVRPVPGYVFRSLTGSQRSIELPVTFPAAAPSSAAVELTLSGHGAEEFPFLNGPTQRRIVHVFVDDREVATAVLVPYVYALAGFGNTAVPVCSGPANNVVGDTLHPLMWWTAQRALDEAGVHTGDGEIPPYRAVVSPLDLDVLAGARTVRVAQDYVHPLGRTITSVSFLLRP